MTEFCAGVDGQSGDKYLCHEGDLGPKNLADGSSPAQLLDGYRRLGDMKPAAFLEKYRTVKIENNKPKTYWHWPNESEKGFLLDTSSHPIASHVDLEPGTLIDRFGHNDTTFFAPFATPFAMRSLPPSSLNDEYAVYEVKQRLRVRAGPIAPGFEQMGLGTQYVCEMNAGDLFKGETWVRKLGEGEVRGLYAPS